MIQGIGTFYFPMAKPRRRRRGVKNPLIPIEAMETRTWTVTASSLARKPAKTTMTLRIDAEKLAAPGKPEVDR